MAFLSHLIHQPIDMAKTITRHFRGGTEEAVCFIPLDRLDVSLHLEKITCVKSENGSHSL